MSTQPAAAKAAGLPVWQAPVKTESNDQVAAAVRNYQQALQTLRSITGVSKQKHSRASAEVTRLTGELRDVNSNLQSVFTQLRDMQQMAARLPTASVVPPADGASKP